MEGRNNMHDEMRRLALKMAAILNNKGAIDIEILNVADMTTITDYFLIASGRNVQAVRALSEDLEDRLAEENIWVSQERKMCCGLGKCGHCRVNDTYICLDGPVFNYVDARTMMD